MPLWFGLLFIALVGTMLFLIYCGIDAWYLSLTRKDCEPVQRKVLCFKWTIETHRWTEIDRWRTPLHYGTAFHTRKQCLKCSQECTDVNEQYGP